jgi:hypothetical protein
VVLSWLKRGAGTNIFHIPLIEPDGRISRFRLSEKGHEVAHGRWRGRLLRRTRPSTLCREALENRLVPDITLCLAHKRPVCGSRHLIFESVVMPDAK